MSKEIDDLLEINSEQDQLETEIKSGNFVQHLFIHSGILFVLIGLCYYLLEVGNSTNNEIAIAFVFAILFLVFFVVLIVETIYYQVKKKYKLRNAALFSMLVFIASMAIILFSLGL